VAPTDGGGPTRVHCRANYNIIARMPIRDVLGRRTWRIVDVNPPRFYCGPGLEIRQENGTTSGLLFRFMALNRSKLNEIC